MEVSFCSIRVEIADSYPNLDIKFSSGRSLEDLFEDLTIKTMASATSSSSAPPPPKNTEAEIKARRGTRRMSDIVVETFTPASTSSNKGYAKDPSPSSSGSSKLSKESTPSSVKRGSSSSSSKESTPDAAAAIATSSATGAAAEKEKTNIIHFSSGNPFVEVTKGMLHLYKENQTTSLEEGVIRSPMICMLGVPAKIKTPDLLQFTAPCHTNLEMIRIIHDGSPNQYMVLFRFRCQDAADEFYNAFNGRQFNSFEQDVCTLVYISKVETCKESEYYPMSGHTELPVCSICLERMDESVSTVLTILCNHTFHGSCLALWEDSSCPVCRYVQTPEVVAEQRCSECLSSEDLWICLVCGYVGCGRYVGGHSHAHFLATQHCYTMELGQNRVWDYVGDNFVHRLVQTDSADGKLVEAQGNGTEGNANSKAVVDGVQVNTDEKMDSIQLEYTYLLTSQLESQRRYYEEKISRLEEQAHIEIEEIMDSAKSSVEERKKLETKMATLTKEKSKSDQKLASLTTKFNKLNQELKEERQMNASLMQNQLEWQNRIKENELKVKALQETKDREVKELQEQIRDLMFYLEAQEKIAKSPLQSEIQGGDVVLLPSQSSSSSKPVGGARSKRKNMTNKHL